MNRYCQLLGCTIIHQTINDLLKRSVRINMIWHDLLQLRRSEMPILAHFPCSDEIKVSLFVRVQPDSLTNPLRDTVAKQAPLPNFPRSFEFIGSKRLYLWR